MTIPLAAVGFSLSLAGAGLSAGPLASQDAIAAGAATVAVSPRIRLLTPVARQLFEYGLLDSPSFRAVVQQLEATDVVVLIVTGRWEPEEGRCHANLRFIGGGPHARFVRVWVDAWWRTRREQVALLAHELWHSVEIGLEPEARSASTVADLFRRIGRETNSRIFETLAAQEIESAVCAELGPSTLPRSARTTR
jgi:hypothetical protein